MIPYQKLTSANCLQANISGEHIVWGSKCSLATISGVNVVTDAFACFVVSIVAAESETARGRTIFRKDGGT
jgi:hypothetical protein